MNNGKPLGAPSGAWHFFAWILVGLVWFSTLQYRDLFDPDEGRYAEIPREMAQSGDWVTPRLNGLKYFEKPPLQYWATAATFKLFGEDDWTARFWSALTGFAGLIVTFYAGSRLFGRRAGAYATLALASSLLYVLIGHVNTLDMGLTFFMTLALFAFLLAQQSLTKRRLWMYLSWSAVGLAVLSKGLVALLLPFLTLLAYSLWNRDWRLWRTLHLGAGLVIVIVITAPWFVLVSERNPEFFNFFFVHEHFSRFLTKVHHRYQPAWYFVPILLMGMLPWTLVMFDSLAAAWRTPRPTSSEVNPARFLFTWVLVVFVFFSISDSKLLSYILPIFPALALLMGQRLQSISARRLFWLIAPIGLLSLAAVVFMPALLEKSIRHAEQAPLYHAYAKTLSVVFVIWTVGLFVTARLLYAQRKSLAIYVVAVLGLFLHQLSLASYEVMSPAQSGATLAAAIRPLLKQPQPVYSLRSYDQTLPFYLKQRVILVDYRGEFDLGLTQEPAKGIPTLEAFSRIWREQPNGVAIMERDTYERLRDAGLPMTVAAQLLRRVVVQKPLTP